jgi:glucosamine--fructose-6-phosphate aminotransferase (isomerizing)
MCGIIGYTGNRPAGPIIIEGLRRLEYRGYDSAGIALFDEQYGLYVERAAGKVEQLAHRIEGVLPPAAAGIGHTRWATHGGATDQNAHPHLDPSGRIAVVHNGIIENFEELQRPFLERGDTFSSETDTEVLAHLIADLVANETDLATAVREVIAMTEGAYALVAIARDEPGRIVAARVGNAGGIVVGYADEECYVASDLAALLPHTRRVTFLEPGEVADVRAGRVEYSDLAGNSLTKAIEVQPFDPVAAVKGRYNRASSSRTSRLRRKRYAVSRASC